MHINFNKPYKKVANYLNIMNVPYKQNNAAERQVKHEFYGRANSGKLVTYCAWDVNQYSKIFEYINTYIWQGIKTFLNGETSWQTD